VVVVSADDFNRSRLRTAVVLAVTSSLRLAPVRGNVLLPKGTAGLDRDAVVNVTELTTVDKDEFEERIGVLPAHVMDEVDRGLRLALQL
jgi:mRNA interferase MazF